jgi:hypothetical protein
VRVLEDGIETVLLRRTDRGEAEFMHLEGFTAQRSKPFNRPQANSTTTMASNSKSKSMIIVYDPVVVTLEVSRIF